jgi:Fur family ferric uptake transcriptional regulator
MIDTALDQLRRAGYRVTRSRRAVVEALLDADEVLLPEDLLRRAQTRHPPLGVVTVYRTLSVLSDLGLVRRIHLANECQGYAWAEHGHGHHIVCRSCGASVEFPGDEDLEGLMEQVARRTGFSVESHILQLSGLCRQCRGG